jgi:adenylate kinase family enzyme
MITPQILFIGPVRAGKSTLAHLVATQLNFPHISQDDVRWNHYREIGYDDQLANHIIYNHNQTPKQSCAEVLLHLE